MVEWWRDSFSVFVGNIPDWGARDLVRIFEAAGVVFDSFVPFDRRLRKRKNYAFVRFKTEREMEKAILLFNGKVHQEKKLQVNKARFGPKNRRKGVPKEGSS